MQTTIVKWGNSRGVRLPKLLLESVNLSDNDIVEITADNNMLIIRKSEKQSKIIEDLFKNFKGEYEPVEIDWGKPVGKEIW